MTPDAERLAALSVAAVSAATAGHPVDDGGGTDPTARRVAAVVAAIAAARPAPDQR